MLLLCLAAGEGRATEPPWARRPAPPPPPDLLVTPAWLTTRRAPGVTVVDARSDSAFVAAHVAGAVHFDATAADPDPWTLGARLGAAGIAADDTVVGYGDAGDPVAAGRLFWLLELAGHRRVRVLDGGLEAWRRAGGPLARGRAVAPARAFAAAPDTARRADFARVRAVFGTKGHTIMEWRPEAAWRDGHIPHSLPFPLGELVGPDGTLLEPRRLRAVFEVYGPRPNEYVPLDDEFVVCGDLPAGAAALHPYLAARLAGIPRVRCYPGGFTDWRAHAGAPVVRVVDTERVRERLAAAPDAVLLDLRERGDFVAGHLPGAVLLPSHRFAREFAAAVAASRPDADPARTPVILYCYGPVCTRSRSCATLAARAGWRELWWFRDGMAGWRGARLPVERGP